MKRYIKFLILTIILFSCKQNNTNQTIEKDIKQEIKEPITSINTSKIYRSLSDGSVKEEILKAVVYYTTDSFYVNFNSDSIWSFKITSIETKKEGNTIKLEHKKYKEVFISSGDLPIINLTTHTDSENITLM